MSETYKHWTIADLPWDRLDPSRVGPDLLKVIKAAALVEYGADAYADYLCKVFSDDPEFQQLARNWAVEEVQHGKALGTWAEKIDPSWNLERAMARFRAGYTPEHFISNDTSSVRGSRSAEMVARCMVETGTSSYYSAIGDSTDEPVLKEICKHIAADEFRHYKLFYDTLNRYLAKENLGKIGRLKVALGRIAESEDDELSYAFYAANDDGSTPYNRVECNRAYVRRAYSFYQQKHLDRAIAMIFKACGFMPPSLPYRIIRQVAWALLNRQTKKLQRMAA
jgi:rubrerythrin